MPAVSARIVSIARHDSGVSLITLAAGNSFHFRAGQYLNVVHPNGTRIPMSIASAPVHLPRLQLHYRALSGVPEAALMNELLAGAPGETHDVTIDGPYGDVHCEGPHAGDLLLIAGGSGIAQCRAIVDHLHGAEQRRRVRLVWSVSNASQLYCDAELRRFDAWLDYVAVIDVPGAENAAVAWLRSARPTGSDRIIVSGGPGFVYAVVDALREIGVADARIESDVFSYAPR